MTKDNVPFCVPAKLTSDLDHVLVYWSSLKRGESEIPFSDDLELSSLSYLSDRLMTIDVFERPQRFRFSMVGKNTLGRYGSDFSGKFADEIDSKSPLDFFKSQASATVEARAPTYYMTGDDVSPESKTARLLLPMWGNGQIAIILGCVARTIEA